MTMTVGDLIGALQELDEDMEVRFASQPGWPFEYSIHSVEVIDLNREETEEEFDPDIPVEDFEEPEPNEVVYLVEGTQLGYLPSVVANYIGWGR